MAIDSPNWFGLSIATKQRSDAGAAFPRRAGSRLNTKKAQPFRLERVELFSFRLSTLIFACFSFHLLELAQI